jgi:hypothetical protein
MATCPAGAEPRRSCGPNRADAARLTARWPGKHRRRWRRKLRPMAMGEVTSDTAPESGSPRAAHPPRPSWGDFWELRRVFGANLLEGLTLIHRRYGAFVRTRLPLQLYLAYPRRHRRLRKRHLDRLSRFRQGQLHIVIAIVECPIHDDSGTFTRGRSGMGSRPTPSPRRESAWSG